MSNRPVARPTSTAFANLKPTIIRQPARSSVSAESEAALLDTPPLPVLRAVAEEVASQPLASIAALPSQPVGLAPATTSGLLQRRRKAVLIPVTFRMPQALKERLEETAKRYEINQTDLINEAIELNLKRYLPDD